MSAGLRPIADIAQPWLARQKSANNGLTRRSKWHRCSMTSSAREQRRRHGEAE